MYIDARQDPAVYIDACQDPEALIDTGQYPHPQSIKTHLLAELIPATLRNRPPRADDQDPLRPKRLHDPDNVRRWLTTLAVELRDAKSGDWRWWHFARHTFTPRQFGLAAGLLFGLATGLTYDLTTGLVVGLVTGLAGARGNQLEAFLTSADVSSPVRIRSVLPLRQQACARFEGIRLSSGWWAS